VKNPRGYQLVGAVSETLINKSSSPESSIRPQQLRCLFIRQHFADHGVWRYRRSKPLETGPERSNLGS
jgi:hypothetical protein